jgi:hypothetical protein
VQRTPLEELDGTLTVKSQAAKKQEAGPGLVFVEGGTFTKFKMMLCMIGIITQLSSMFSLLHG